MNSSTFDAREMDHTTDERVFISQRLSEHEGMVPSFQKQERDMNTDIFELSLGDLDGVAGGDINCKVTEVKDINMGILGTIHVDTIQCGGTSGTAVSYSPYRPA
jgi:hypothetical protein